MKQMITRCSGEVPEDLTDWPRMDTQTKDELAKATRADRDDRELAPGWIERAMILRPFDPYERIAARASSSNHRRCLPTLAYCCNHPPSVEPFANDLEQRLCLSEDVVRKRHSLRCPLRDELYRNRRAFHPSGSSRPLRFAAALMALGTLLPSRSSSDNLMLIPIRASIAGRITASPRVSSTSTA